MDDVLTATNPETGAKIAKIDGQWTPVDATATNPKTGEKMYQKDGAWNMLSSASPQVNTVQESGLSAQLGRMGEDVKQTNKESGKLFDGIGEAAANAVTGIGSSAAGGLSGLWHGVTTLAKGGSVDDALQNSTKAIQDVQNKYTYTPKTGVGKLASEALSLPLTAAKAVGEKAGEGYGMLYDVAKNGGVDNLDLQNGVGANIGRAIGNVTPDIAATLLGGASALKSARGFSGRSPVQEQLSATGQNEASPTINYDVPTFIRKGIASPGLSDAKQVYTPSSLANEIQVAQEAGPVNLALQSSNVNSAATIAGATDDIQSIMKSIGQESNEPIQPIPEETTNLNKTHEQRLKILRDVGLENIRKSAIEGDAAKGAQDYQTSKYTSEPAGMAALDQFNAEREALANHAQSIIDKTQAPSGLDEQSMQTKGQVIAAPYDAAKAYFEAAKNNLYKIADQRAEESNINIDTKSLDSILSDPDFKATLMAKDQQGLLNTIQSQYERFKNLNEDGNLTVKNAENYRKWLNKIWSPDNSATLGAVKNALDQDVFKSAGEDVYDAGRKMHQLEKRTLDDPNGISKLFDSDPYAPINRATPYNKIPDSIINLSTDQFKHIIDTFKDLPPELQTLSQKAIDTIKAHYGDKILQAGTETRSGVNRQLWNNFGVNKIMLNNSSKIPMIFTSPDEISALNNLRDAGNILNVNTAYPGASAQAANAFKQGLMSKTIGKAGTVIGGGIGSIGGPITAGLGAFLGDSIGSKISTGIGEKKAIEQFNNGIIKPDNKKFPPPPRR